MQESLSTIEYKAGNCNIGPEEIDRRYRIGYLGLAGMAIFIIVDLNFRLPQVWKLVLFAPTVYALSGFLQARHKFCFFFGFFGLFSFGGKRLRVTNKLQAYKDRTKALWLMVQIFIGSVAVTLAYYLLT